MRKVVPLLLLLLLGGGAFLLLRPRADAPIVGEDVDDAGPAAGRAPAVIDPTLARAGGAARPRAPASGAPPDDPDTASDAPATDGPRVEGAVIDDVSGEPIPGAVVVVSSPTTPCPSAVPAAVFEGGFAVAGPDPRSGPGRSVGKVPTDEAGRFGLAWDEPTADLVVRRKGYLVATACALAVNTTTTVRLRKGASITGVVVSPTGAPVAGVEVGARPPRGLPETPGRVEATTSDAEGRFVVEGLLPEAFDLAFRHPAYFDEARPEVAASTRNLRVVMRPAFAVTFRLTTDDQTKPETPTVEWRLAGGGPGEIAILTPAEKAPPFSPGLAELPPSFQEAAPPVGTFLYAPLKIPAGRPTATFVVKAIGFEPWSSEPVEVPAEGGATTLDVALRRDPTLGRARIAVEDREHRVLSFADEQCSVVLGRRDGKAVPAGVILFAKEAVEFPALEGGPWRFVVRSPRWAPATVDLDVRAAGETEGRAVLSPTARLKVRFFATEPLLVKFRLVQGAEVVWPFVEKAAADGTPEVEETGDEQTSSSGSEGIVLTGLAPGRYTVEGVSPDVSVPPTPVDLTEGETKDVEITVARK